MALTDPNVGIGWSGTIANAPYLHTMMTDWISPTIHNALNNEATILSVIPKDNTKYYGGQGVKERVKFGRNPRQMNAVGDDGYFPEPANRKARWYAYRSRQQFARFLIQGKLMRAAQRGQMSSPDPLEEDIADFLEDYIQERCRQMYSDGSGRLCEIAEAGAAATTQTFTLRVNQDIATGYGHPSAVNTGMPQEAPTKWLEEGERILIVTAAGVPKAICNVDAIVDDDEATFTALAFVSGGTAFNATGQAGGDSTVAIGDWVVKTGRVDFSSNARALEDSAFKHEPMGLNGILGYNGPLDGTGPAMEVGADIQNNLLEGQSPTTLYQAYLWGGSDFITQTLTHYFQGLPANSSAAGWTSDMGFNRALLNNNAGAVRPPTEALFMRQLTIARETNNADINFWLSTGAARDKYAESLVGEKRYNDTLDLKGGWAKNLSGPGGLPWVTDRKCTHNSVYGMSLEDGGFTQWIMQDLDWATMEGASVWQFLQDADKYQARMVEEDQIGVGVRDRCGMRILDIQEV